MKLLIVLFCLLVTGFSEQVRAQGQAYNGKLMLTVVGGLPFAEHGSAFLIDKQSLGSSSLHKCSSEILVVTSNDLLKGQALDAKAKIKFQLPFSGNKNVFKDFELKLKGRDYFSGSAILEPVNARMLISDLQAVQYDPICVGISSGSNSGSYVQGFTYYSLQNQMFNMGQWDAGLSGALSLDSSRRNFVGMIVRDYFASETDKKTGLMHKVFSDLKGYANRIYRDQTQSSKGVMQYIQNEEAFAYKGKKDAFAMVPVPKAITGRVQILGSPDEVFSSATTDLSQYKYMRDNNAFADLPAYTGKGSTYYLKTINGADASTWSKMQSILTRIPEQSSPVIEYEVNSPLGKQNFLAGNQYLEYVSLIRWVAKTRLAVLDKDTPALKGRALSAIQAMNAPATKIYKTFSQYPLSALATMNMDARKNIFEDLKVQARLMRDQVWDSNNEIGSFREREGRTLFMFQQWVLALEKWVSVEASKLTRSTRTTLDD